MSLQRFKDITFRFRFECLIENDGNLSSFGNESINVSLPVCRHIEADEQYDGKIKEMIMCSGKRINNY